MCIEYLHTSIYIYVYTLNVYHSSGAYCGGTVGSVEGVAAHDHRDSIMINTGSAIISTVKSRVDESFE